MTYPVTRDLAVWRNDDFTEEWPFTDGVSDAEPGDTIDLTGWSGAMEVRLYAGASGAALITLATVTTDIEGIRFIDPANGVIAIRIQDTTITALPAAGKVGQPAIFYYDLVLTDPAGDRHNVAGGKFTVYPKVTA